MIRFMHLADLHLDSPFKGLSHLPSDLFDQIQQSSFQSFERLVETAIDEQVDFVLIAGDVFDIHTRSIRAQRFLINQCNRLNDAQIPLFISYGNHDYVEDDRFYLTYPDNVHVFDETVSTKTIKTASGEWVAISGFSYHSRHIHQNRMSEFPTRDEQADYHIGLYHGDVSSQSTDYAPFELNDISQLHYDYMALGHIHQRQALSTQVPAYYSGTIQGRHRNEEGDKGALLVELNGREHHVTFIPTAPVIWQTASISVDETDTVETISNIMTADIPNDDRLYLVTGNLSIESDEAIKLVDALTAYDMNQLIQSPTIFVHKLKSKLVDSLTPLEHAFPNSFSQTVSSDIYDEFEPLLAELGKKISLNQLSRFNDQTVQQDIIQKAIERINQSSKG